MDNLSKDMVACKKAGFGSSYGKWKATQPVVDSVPQPPNGKVKVCKNCGKEFVEPPRKMGNGRIFCNMACQIQYNQHDYIPIDKKCEFCGKEFQAMRTNHRFCCNRCSAMSRDSKRKEMNNGK